jgi:hypothetical protein
VECALSLREHQYGTLPNTQRHRAPEVSEGALWFAEGRFYSNTGLSVMRLASGDKSTEGQLYATFKPLALQWFKAAKSPGHIDGKIKIVLRRGIKAAHVYCQMLQRGLEGFRPIRQGVHHGGACILERDAVELSELTNHLSLFLGETGLDAKSVKTRL